MNRQLFLKSVLLLLAPVKSFSKDSLSQLFQVGGNFKKIYSDSELKGAFFPFLKNVFNLFPEEKLHELIAETTTKKELDREIYLEAQAKLEKITPPFVELSHQLPALFKQKDEMARQAAELLGEPKVLDGYLEIGSSGRYLDYLEEIMEIKGTRYYADGKEPGYSVTEMIDRGQIAVGATYIPLADYRTRYSDFIPKESLDLVTVYIGFHHCPIDLRIPFISSIRDTMRPGAKLILRDHDCDTEEQRVLVALAHDVFNMGTKETWEYNEAETRNFYSLSFICSFIEELGFTFDKRTLFQDGDPTKNALMMFTKI